MKIIKRLLLWIAISIIPLLIVILVWLITFQSFNFTDAVHSLPFRVVTGLCTLLGLVISLCLDQDEIDEIIS